MKNKITITIITLFCVSVFAQKNITLEDIWTNGTFSPKGISEIRSMKDGEHYCILKNSGIEKYNYAKGKKVSDICLFRSPEVLKHAKPLPPIESYQFDNSETKILLSSGFEPIYRRSGKADYYLYDMSTKKFTKLSNNGKQQLTTFSPDGTKIGFVRDNNLFIMDINTFEETQITFDGKFNEIINGTMDWVYEEELGIIQGFYWSPDSKKIAFYRFNESDVKQYAMQIWGNLYPELYTYKYPKAGEMNSTVDIVVYDLENRNTRKLNIGSENDQYIPRIQWTKDANTLSLLRMNRLQNRLEILLSNVNTGDITSIYTETDSAYVEVPEVWIFLNDKKHFLISSEKDGFNHIYLYDITGKPARQITSGNYEVVAINGIDETNKKIYYTSTESSPLNAELYVIGMDGKKKKKLSTLPGTYSCHFSNTCTYYISTFTDANTPPIYTIHASDGKQLVALENNRTLAEKMKTFGNEQKMFGTLTTPNHTELNYYIIKPADFDSTKKYPVFFYVYGGPGSQMVANSFGRSDYFWLRMLAQNGYICISIDGRGTGKRGAAFRKATYKQLGKYECEDVISAANYFAKLPYVDKNRIGIFGWSFGGYLSSLAITKGADIFKTAIAVAPVTSWRYYDNIYTERFMQRPLENGTGYDENSPIHHADKLKGNYLLIHGSADDNVHIQNTMDMATALIKAGKQFEMFVYPNKNHSIYGGNTRWHLYTLMTDFIYRKL